MKPGRFGACALLGLGLLGGCTQPETVLKKEPARALQVTFQEGTSPELAQVFSDALNLPLVSSNSNESRTLHLEIRTRPNPFAGHGWSRYAFWDTCMGGLGGLQVGIIGVNLRFCGYATGAGLLIGLACSPFHYQADQRFLQQKGYLPSRVDGKWFISGPGQTEPSGTLPVLDFRDQLPKLPPEARTEADIRRESLRAYAKTLALRWNKP